MLYKNLSCPVLKLFDFYVFKSLQICLYLTKTEPFSFLSQHLYSLLFYKVLCAWIADEHLLNVFWCILCLKFKQQWQQTPPKWWKSDKGKCWASLVAQKVKNPRAMQETWVRSMGQEDLLEKRMATHFSILAWKIPFKQQWQQTLPKWWEFDKGKTGVQTWSMTAAEIAN